MTYYIDDVRAVKEASGLHRPELTVSRRSIVFPVEMIEGDRLVFKSMDNCRLYRKGAERPEAVHLEGAPPVLNPGRNRVVFALDAASPSRFDLTVSLSKHYP